jgi:glycosyltransferase involved in cell wall biosynthesis
MNYWDFQAYSKASVREDAKFSIVIPTWNSLAYLQNCIRSIRKNSSYTHQILVHINEGSDGTLEWVKDQDDIDYTYSRKNIGVCFALNAARTLVKTDYFLFLNDDMYLLPGWDIALWDEVQKVGHEGFFLAGTLIEPRAPYSCIIEKDYGRNIETFDEEKLLSEYASLQRPDWRGASLPPNLVHIRLWDLVGGYSIELNPGESSDPDFVMKLWKAGVRYYKGVGACMAYHFGSRSVKRVKMNKGFYQFINKWGFAPSYVTKYILRRGEPFEGPLPEYQMDAGNRAKNFYKNLRALVNRK